MNDRRHARSVRIAGAVVSLALLGAGVACSSDDAPAPGATSSTDAGTNTGAGTGSGAVPSTVAPPTSSPYVGTPAATPVAPPTPGSVDSTVPTRPEQTKKAVQLDRPSAANDGLTVELSRIQAIQAKAQGPGEVAGPALAVTVEVDNASTEDFDLSSVAVTLLGADQSPGGLMSASPSDPLTGSVAKGKRASGVYVFTLAKDNRSPVTVQVQLAPSLPTLLFRGRPSS